MDSIRGTAFLQFGELLAQHGASIRDHLAPHRINLDVVGNYEKKLPYQSLAQIFEGSAQALNMPEFGLELATRQGSTLLGPLQYLAQSAPTVGDGLVALIRYMRLYSPAIHYRLERRHGRALLYFENTLPNSLEIPQIVEKSVLQARLIVAELLGAPFRPRAVLFRHQPLASLAVYQRYFGCTALFQQEHNAIEMTPEDLQRPCAQHDAMLHSIVRFYLEAHCIPDGLQAEVRQQIQALLPRQRCNLEQVAQILGLHARTLQRRLASDGVDFEQQVDQVRRRQAEQLLRHSSLSVAQIASELGYLRPASFCRAHQRWFAMTPLEHRRLYGQGGASSLQPEEDD
ncbi:HTH-type transcriptional regulator VirS [compost metagenome]